MGWSWGGSGARLLNFTPKYVAENVQLLIITTGFVKKGEKRQKKKKNKKLNVTKLN